MSARARPNNFDHLRLLLALTVLLGHLPWLSGQPALAWASHCFNAKLAVDGFFIISGCLVAASHARSRSFADYMEKRIRRIYPAYAAVIALSVLLGAFISHTEHYWRQAETWRYLAWNMAFLNFKQPTLPGVFEHNTMHEVNGALWTIKVEVMFYLLLPLLALLAHRFGALRMLAAVYALSLAYYLAAAPHSAELAHQLPGQLRYFAVGMALYYFPNWWRTQALRWLAPALLIAALYSFDIMPEALEAVYPLAMGIIIAAFAWRLPPLGNLMRLGDISYGVYILHFPVIQLAVQMHWLDRAPYTGAALLAAAIVALAVVLWYAVEKPALRRDSHYKNMQ